MADSRSINDFLLTPIVAPSLTDANYASGINQSFVNINSNFNKLLSAPFLQGADGKDFELYKQNLFNTDNPDINSSINDWCRSMLYSIYKQDGLNNPENGTITFNSELKTILENSGNLAGFHAELYDLLTIYGLNQFYPIVIDENDHGKDVYADITLLDMPYVWTYITRNDKDEINSQFVAQYYRFLDGRLVTFRNGTSIDFSSLYFDELSCFLTYDPSQDASEKFGVVNVFDRVYLTPTLHYDRETGDWLWVVNGEITGISAKGVQGESGDTGARCWYGIVVDDEFQETDDIITHHLRPEQISYFLLSTDSPVPMSPSSDVRYSEWVPASNVTADIKSGDLVFCLVTNSRWVESSSNPEDWSYFDAFMNIITKYKEGERMVYHTFYNTQYSFWKYLAALKAFDIFKHLGIQDPNNSGSRGIWIPADPDLSTHTEVAPVHMLYADDKTDQDKHNYNLRIQVSPHWNETSEYVSDINQIDSRLIVDNYLLNVGRILIQDNLNPDESMKNVRNLASNILNVIGNSKLSGNIYLGPKNDGEPNGLYINDYNEIKIEGTNGINISTKTYENTVKEKYQVNKGESLLIENQKNDVEKPYNEIISNIRTVDKRSSSQQTLSGEKIGMIGGVIAKNTTTQEETIHTPRIFSEYSDTDRLYAGWENIGNVCLINPNITSTTDNKDVLEGFKYLYRVSGNSAGDLLEKTIYGSSITLDSTELKNNSYGLVKQWQGGLRITEPGSQTATEYTPLDSTWHTNVSLIPSGKYVYQKKYVGGWARFDLYSSYISNTRTNDNIPGSNRKRTFEVIIKTDDKNRKMSDLTSQITSDNDIQTKLSNTVLEEAKKHIPDTANIKNVECDIVYNFNCCVFNQENSNLAFPGLFWLRSKPSGLGSNYYSVTRLSNAENGRMPFNSGSKKLISTHGSFVGSGDYASWSEIDKAMRRISKTIDQNISGVVFNYSGGSNTLGSNVSANANSKLIDALALPPYERTSNGLIDVCDIDFNHNGSLGNNSGWSDTEMVLGKFGVELSLKKATVNIKKITYEDTKQNNKFIICPKGIFFCSSSTPAFFDDENPDLGNIYSVAWNPAYGTYDINTNH